MANHRGIVSAWDTQAQRPKGVVSPADLRWSLAALARSEGVMLEAGAAVLTHEPQAMALSWTAFTAVIASPLGGWYMPRIGAGSIDLDAGDASYPRVDTIWVRQWDHQVSGDHPDSELEIGVTTGTPSATPKAPPAPTGALAVWQVMVPKGAVLGSDVPADGVTRCRWTAPVGGPPVGVTESFMGRVAPLGWLMCQGQRLGKGEYPELWEVIGDLTGQATDTTFTLPDCRKRVAVGRADSGPLSVLGATGGEEKHTLTVEEMPRHQHRVREGGVDMSVWQTNLSSLAGQGNWRTPDRAGTGALTAVETNIQGGSQPHNIMQPYIVTNVIIRAI